MDKGRTRIAGEMDKESGSINVTLEGGGGVEGMILIATAIKNLSNATGVSVAEIMEDITTILSNKWLNDNLWRTADERVEEE